MSAKGERRKAMFTAGFLIVAGLIYLIRAISRLMD
jgi:hypothetical protein